MTTNTEKPTVAFIHSGEEVTLTWSHKFHSTLTDQTYNTAQQAKDAIDRRQKAEERIKKRKLMLAVIGEDGIERVVNSIHASNGKLLAKPSLDTGRFSSRTDCFPKVDWISKAIAEKQELRAKADAIEEALLPFQLSPANKSYGYDLDVEKAIDALEKDYAAKLKRAQGTSLDTELKAAESKPKKGLRL